MNQDTRICKLSNGNFYLTYNMFSYQNNITYVKMVQRKIVIGDTFFYLYPEEDMLSQIPHNSVEKNCVYDCHGTILYSINGAFKVIQDNKLIVRKATTIANIINTYGKENIFFS